MPLENGGFVWNDTDLGKLTLSATREWRLCLERHRLRKNLLGVPLENGGFVWNDTDLGKLTWSDTCLYRPGPFISQACWEYNSSGTKLALNQQHQKT